MTNPSKAVAPVVQRVVLCLLAATLLTDIGCVSRRAYEQIKAETIEHTQALETAREDIKELDQQIAGLQAANRRENITIDELLAVIQREQELLPIMHEEAEERHSSLKTQVASLLDQSWHLARKIADLRQASASLQTMAAQYKEEMKHVQAQAQAHAPVLVASHSEKPSITNSASTTTEEPSSPPTLTPVEEEQPSSLTSDEESAPTHVAQAVSPPPDLEPVAPPASSSSVNVEPSTTNDSWIDMITGWLLAFWNWLIS